AIRVGGADPRITRHRALSLSRPTYPGLPPGLSRPTYPGLPPGLSRPTHPGLPPGPRRRDARGIPVSSIAQAGLAGILGGQHPRPVRGDRDLVLEVRGPAPVRRDVRPPVVP